MTKLKGILIALAIAVFSTATFASSISASAQKQMRKQIAHYLQNVDLTKYNVDEATIYVTFMVNQENEIVVLSTNNTDFDKELKSRLNYKNLKIDESIQNQVYSVPITLKA